MSKVLPLIATGLFTLVCGITAIWADPALGFLRYWAAAGTVIGVFLIRYILKSDEVWITGGSLLLQSDHGITLSLGNWRKRCECTSSQYRKPCVLTMYLRISTSVVLASCHCAQIPMVSSFAQTKIPIFFSVGFCAYHNLFRGCVSLSFFVPMYCIRLKY